MVKTTIVLYLIIVRRVQKEKVPWPIVVQNTGLGLISLKFPLTPTSAPPNILVLLLILAIWIFHSLKKKILTDNSKKMSICELRTARNKFSIENFWLFWFSGLNQLSRHWGIGERNHKLINRVIFFAKNPRQYTLEAIIFSVWVFREVLGVDRILGSLIVGLT